MCVCVDRRVWYIARGHVEWRLLLPCLCSVLCSHAHTLTLTHVDNRRFSIFNSFMMVLFLCGIVALILMRTLRNDYAKVTTHPITMASILGITPD